MHELGLMRDALDSVLEHARERGASRVHRVTLRVGDLSGLAPEALRFAFEALKEGTAAEGAELELQCVPVVCNCPRCGEEYRPADVVFVCPRCAALGADVKQGRELLLQSIEVS